MKQLDKTFATINYFLHPNVSSYTRTSLTLPHVPLFPYSSSQAAAEDAKVAAQLTPQVLLDSKVRECDLLQSQMLLREARVCWGQAQGMFPANILVLNELGNVLSQVSFLVNC